MKGKKRSLAALLALLCLLVLSGCGPGKSSGVETDAKPVIYCCPEEETPVTVELLYDGELSNTCSLISFQGEAYTDAAQLRTTPEPDTLLRIFMAWKPLKEALEIPAQVLEAPERTGFTVVAWGGARVNG